MLTITNFALKCQQSIVNQVLQQKRIKFFFKNYNSFNSQKQQNSRCRQRRHLRSFTPFVTEFDLCARNGCFDDFLSRTHTFSYFRFCLTCTYLPNLESLQIWLCHQKGAPAKDFNRLVAMSAVQPTNQSTSGNSKQIESHRNHPLDWTSSFLDY